MQKLDNLLAAYHFADLASGIGGLQLLPQNADRLGRLEYLAELTAQRRPPTDWRPAASLEQWDHLVNDSAVIPTGIITQEDPFNYPFTESFTFFDGSHTVLGGLAEAGPFVARLVSAAIFQSESKPGTPEFRRWAGRLLLATLHLGDEIARRAGLGRGVRPERTPDGRCVVPAWELFSQLKHAVTFTSAELAEIFAKARTSTTELDPLILQLRLHSDPHAGREPQVIARPILRLPDRYVVLAPGNLLTAARHAVVSRAVAEGCGSALAIAYRNSAFVSVYQSLERMGMKCLGVTPPDRPGPFVEGEFRFDTDKVAHVLLAADTLTDWDAGTVFGNWNTADLGASVPALQSAALTRLLDPHSRLGNVMQLTVIQGIGRGFVLGYDPLQDDPRCRPLNMSAESLDVLSWLPETRQLTLWQFAQARHEVRRRARVFAWDPLDEFGFYRSHRCSYYATDDGTPTMLSLVPDFAEPLRCEAHERADRLAVVHPDSRSIVEVYNFHGDRTLPIHCLLPGSGLPFSLHVGQLPLSVWVLAPELVSDVRYKGLYFQFVDMVAYWVWQLSAGLERHLAVVAQQLDRLVIELELLPGEQWFNYSQDQAGDATLRARSVGHDRVRLTIGPGLVSRFASADNAGERHVMRALLGGLRDWGQRLRVPSLGNLTDRQLWEMIDLHAPLGVKKKLLMLNAGQHPELNETGLPRFRPVQAFDEQQVLDAVGQIAGWQFGTEPDEVPDDQRVVLLNGLVGKLYGDLQRLVALLSPNGLIDALVAQNERIVREREFCEFTIPTRAACFGAQSTVMERLCDELQEFAKAAIASRFLIEYASARPPVGIQPFSLAAYDRLLALAAQIISFGMSSDAIRYGLSNRSLAVLPSGRLGVGDSLFESTLDDFRAAHSQDVASRSRAMFNGRWLSEPARPRPEVERLMEQMDVAATAEFGLSLRELNDFLGEVIVVGLELPGEPKSLAVDALLDRLTIGLGWPRERVAQAFGLFELRPRPDFLVPPDGFESAEVFPWRYNRRLSYIRRPLLVRIGADGEEVVWGVRTVNMAARYLSSLCTGGRLIARTQAMRKAMGAFHTYQGREFNRRVAELYQAVPGLLVRERVKKVRHMRITRPNGQDLGDIDVLVADPNSRTLTPVETKDLTAALTPPELRNEMGRLFGSTSSRRGDLDRFAERVAWVRANLGAVLRHLFGITDDAGGWTVRPTLVLDQEIISPRLARRPDLTVYSVRELQASLCAAPDESILRE